MKRDSESQKARGRLSFATRAIHSGYDPEMAGGDLVPPVHITSTFTFRTAADAAAAFAGTNRQHIYTRISNPTLALLEERVADLEGAQAGVSFASGMGAIASVLWTLLKPGDTVLADQALYGGTFALMHGGLARYGVKIEHVDFSDQSAVVRALATPKAVAYFETPSNPLMKLIDIKAVCEAAREAGAVSVVDNTFATPVITRPCEHGADIVVHSATKYLGGHGDLVGGVAVGAADMMERVRLEGLKDMTGAALAPFNAMLILRGLKTLSLRMQRHSESAEALSVWLKSADKVQQVRYPGLSEGRQREIALRQMSLPGGIITFDIKGGQTSAQRLIDKLRLIRCAVSLGDAESLIQHPATMTHSTYSPEQREQHGIGDGLLRISVGLEDAKDLIRDLERAF